MKAENTAARRSVSIRVMPGKCWWHSGGLSGHCPTPGGELNKDQATFLDQSIAGLAEDGKIISRAPGSVRRNDEGQAVDPGHAQGSGWHEGVGVTFLEETFSASTAPPEHRLHQKAAQRRSESAASRERHRHQGSR